MSNWLNVGIRGHATWPQKETLIKFAGYDLLLKPATKSTEQSMHINLIGISDQDALTLINRFLSILSWCDGVPMENLYGFSTSKGPVPILRNSSITVGSCIIDQYPFYRNIEDDPKARLALALYREALTVNSGPFSFLSYFKILNIFWKDKYEKRSNEMIQGIRETLPLLEDEQAIKRIEKLNKIEVDVPKYLYESGRCAIAHAYSHPLVDPDNVGQLRRLSEDEQVVRAIAEYLIEHKLGISRSILGP